MTSTGHLLTIAAPTTFDFLYSHHLPVASPTVKIPVYYLHQVAEIIADMGVDLHAWLGRSQLHSSQLEDVKNTLSFSTFRQLIRDALAMTQEPALGLLIGRRLLLNNHGVLGYAAMNSSSLQQAIEVLERYSLLRTPLVSLNHHMDAQHLRVTVSENYPLDDIRSPMHEVTMLGVKNVVDYLAAGTQPVTQVMFAFPQPAYATLAHEVFQCEVRYDQPDTGFLIPTVIATQALNRSDPNTYREALLICQRELDKVIQDESLATRVRRVLIERSNAFPSLQLTARLFHMTPRTLHRNLLKEGTSYRGILEEVRYLLAVEHLKSGQLSIQEIAFSLGYTDTANFRRAFKRWHGMAPSDYRQHQTGG